MECSRDRKRALLLPDDIDLIASAIAGTLRRPARQRIRHSSPRQRLEPAVASAIAAIILSKPGRRRRSKPAGNFAQVVSAIASQVAMRLAPAPARQDLPMDLIEI
jgi:hypothetical protein